MRQGTGPSPGGATQGNPNVPPLRGCQGSHPVPTVSTVGYVVASLRDFEHYKRRGPCIFSRRDFLRERVLSFISPRIHIGCTLRLSPPRRNHEELPLPARGGSWFADCVFFASCREAASRARHSK